MSGQRKSFLSPLGNCAETTEMRALLLSCVLVCSAALRLPAVLRQSESALSRRSFGAQAASGLAALALGSTAANAAEEPSRMGGILEPYVDAPRGFKLLKPSGWNKVRPPPSPSPAPTLPKPAFRSLQRSPAPGAPEWMAAPIRKGR